LSTDPLGIRLVVLDWAGTTVDHGSFSPVAAFVETFAHHGVAVSTAEARVPMGLHKKDHLRALLEMPGVARRWRQIHGADWTEADVETLFNTFTPLQLEAIDKHSRLVPGLLECVAELRRQGLIVSTTTGFFRAAAERLYASAREQGFVPDVNVHPEMVRAGRPAPWMIYRIMETVGVYPPARVVKVGDTIPDVEEGQNAGVWSVGVLHTSSEVACSEEEWRKLSEEEQQKLRGRAQEKLRTAGAHAVIDTVAELPVLLSVLNARIQHGERP
jgi:phosphonoacetaldehyde hydrolase